MRTYTKLTYCQNGHDISIEGRNSNRDCKVCNRERQHLPKVRQYKRHYYENVTRNSPQYDHLRRDRIWKRNGVKNLDGTQFLMIDFDREYQKQQGRCGGCHRHQTELSKVLCVDHDHVTGQFRGLLCGSCNTALGMAKDSIQILNSLISYLQR